jgi:hypothetical protein
MGANSPYVDGGAIEIVAQYLASGPPNLTADGYRNLQVDAAGNLKVNVVIGGGGGGGGTASSVTLNDPTTTTNQAAVLAPGGSGAFALAVQGVPGGTPQPVLAASLPLPTGAATSALQPSLGTAGTPSSNVITVQGISSMTPFKVDGSGVTQPVSIATMPALVASTANIGQVGGKTAKVSVSPTVTASAYATGNVVGGKITFSNALLTAGSGVLESIWLKIKTVQTATFQLSLFDSNPTNSTWTDKAAPAINVADLPFLIGTYALSTPLSVLGTETIYTLDAIGHAINAGATTLYGILTVTGTPTFGSTSDISVALGILQD